MWALPASKFMKVFFSALFAVSSLQHMKVQRSIAIKNLGIRFSALATSILTAKTIQEPVSVISKVILARGGHLSFGDAISSPLALALHSGRFAVTQQSMRKIPGKERKHHS